MKRGVLMKAIEYSKNEINAMGSGISIQLQYLVNMKTYLAYKKKEEKLKETLGLNKPPPFENTIINNLL